MSSILTSAEEASKLSDKEQSIGLLVSAAELLPAANREDAIRLLEIAWSDLKEWSTDENAGWGRRYRAATLRNHVLSAYARFDLDRVVALRKESQPKPESDEDPSSLRTANWTAEILDRRKRADETANIALSIIGIDIEKASALVLQSVQSGVISSSIYKVFQKLQQDENRLALNNLENSMSRILPRSVALDPLSLLYGPILVQSDRDMPTAARRGFQVFFLNSLRAWADLALDENKNGALDPSYIGSMFLAFVLHVRPVIAPGPREQLMAFDLLLDRVSSLVPAKTKSLLQSLSPEAAADPRSRLVEIMKEKDAEARDNRLTRFVLDIVRKSSKDGPEGDRELASDAISEVSDAKLKAALSDFVAITHVSFLAKQKDFIEARHATEFIHSIETRSWALLALASEVGKQDRILAFEFVNQGLKILEGASPGPKKAELTLIASAMLAKDDSQRAFDVFLLATKYANSSQPEAEQQSDDLAGGLRLEVSIGSSQMILAQTPASLGDIKIDKSLSLLAKADWFRAQQITDGLRDPALRLSLKLLFSEAILTGEPKEEKTVAHKPSLN